MVSLRLTLAFFFSIIFLSGLSAQKDPMKWGKVDDADLKMTVYEPDSSAEAVVLGDYGNLEFNFAADDMQVILQKHKRIKILKRAGFHLADVAIPYYSYQRKGKIVGLKAQVITPEGKEIQLKKKDFFEEQINDYWTQIKFTFPNVERGSIIEWTYDMNTEIMFELPEWYFQDEIPVRWSEYRLHIPEFYNYVSLIQGKSLEINEHTENQQQINYRTSNSAFGGTKSNSATVMINHYRFAQSNMPALRKEAFITTMDDYRSRIRFQLGTTKFNGIVEPVLTDWSRVAKELMESEDFGIEINRKRRVKDAVEAIAPHIPAEATETEKAGLIYSYLANELNWNGSYGKYATSNIDEVYEKKEGSGADLNLFLTSVLQEFRINAQPALISTRNNGRTVELYPILDQFNHVVTVAVLEGKEVILDLGNRYRPAGLPHENALNKRAWVVNPLNPRWIDINVPETKSVTMAELTLSEEGQLEGNIKMYHSGYSAVNERERLSKDADGDFVKDDLREIYPEANFENLEITNKDNPYETLNYNFDVNIPQAVMAASGYMYLQPVLVPEFEENPFKQEERLFPVDMPYPFNVQSVIKIAIPDGYAVEELPTNISLTIPSKGAQFTFMVVEEEGALSIICRLKISQIRYEIEEYHAVKEVFDMLISKQNEQIVLHKKS